MSLLLLAQPVSYELVGGHFLEGVLEEHEQGQYLPVRPVGQRDTLWLWVEGVTPNEGPSRKAAASADIVVWCYPGRFPDPRHPLPDAEQIKVVRRIHDDDPYITVMPQ